MNSIFRSLIAFKWLLRAIEHHGSSVIYGINFIVNGFHGDQDEENFIAFVEHSKLANVYLNHSTKLLPEVYHHLCLSAFLMGHITLIYIYSRSDEISVFRFLKVFKKLNPSLTTGLGDENLERYCDDAFSTNENKKIT